MASVDANSDAEAGIILRFHDADNYLVALYSPSLKAIFLHDRKDGQWGDPLGEVAVPEIGPKIHLTAAACGDYAAMVLTDGKKTYYTPIVKVTQHDEPERPACGCYQIGDRQEFDNFELSRTPLVLPKLAEKALSSAGRDAKTTFLPSDEYRTPNVPSPQDWVLVLERVKL